MTESADTIEATVEPVPLQQFVRDAVRGVLDQSECSHDEIVDAAIAAVRTHDALSGQMPVPMNVMQSFLALARQTQALGAGANDLLHYIEHQYGSPEPHTHTEDDPLRNQHNHAHGDDGHEHPAEEGHKH